jgi:hypothetical protein
MYNPGIDVAARLQTEAENSDLVLRFLNMSLAKTRYYITSQSRGMFTERIPDLGFQISNP